MTTALEHEITVSQVALFQQTGKLLDAADKVREERERLLTLLARSQAERTDKQREVSTNDR